MSESKPNRSARLNLLAMAAIVVVPPIAATILYFTWRPTAFVNYGELITPVPLAQVAPPGDPALVELDRLKGKWVLLTVDGGACDDYCRHKLYLVRQLRLTQGKEMERIERAWLIDDDAATSPALLQEYQGTARIPARGSALLATLPVAGALHDHVWLIDPLGNLMLRYPRDPDPNRMKKDLARLLRASRIG
jgi:cytochrome oxidase Cu insertion factor (SCO1/SenC/PrrC family)